MSDFFPGFEQRQIETSGATINLVTGGSGPPLLCSKPGKKSGIVASISLIFPANACVRGNVLCGTDCFGKGMTAED